MVSLFTTNTFGSTLLHQFSDPEATMANSNMKRVRGLPIPPLFLEVNVEGAMDYTPEDGDIIMAAYPKTGSAWVKYIVIQILTEGRVIPSYKEALFEVCPLMEAAGISVLKSMKSPRSYSHHLPYNQVIKNPKSKVIYTYRHPEDTLVSSYHFLNNVSERSVNLDTHFARFMSGDMFFGNYIDHVMSYVSRKDDPNLFLVSYEDLKRDTRDQVVKIAQFLGPEHHQNVTKNGGLLLEKVIKNTSFENMREKVVVNRALDGKKIDFFRKGEVGEGRKELSSEQAEKLKGNAREKLGSTDVFEKWYSSV